MRVAASVRCGRLADSIGGAALVALLLHEVSSIQQLGFELVVSATAQAQVLHRAAAAEGDGTHVVVFEHRAFGTARALLAHERAALAVALGDLALDLGGNVTRVAVRTALPRGIGVAELAPLEPLHEVRERQLQDVGDIASWLGVRQQLLRAAKQVVRVLAQRELNGVAAGGDRGDARGGGCARGRLTACDTRVVVGENLPRGKFA